MSSPPPQQPPPPPQQPIGYGGPHAAFPATSQEYKRLMLGRIIGALLANMTAMYTVYHGPEAGLKKLGTVEVLELPFFDTVKVKSSDAKATVKVAYKHEINLRLVDQNIPTGGKDHLEFPAGHTGAVPGLASSPLVSLQLPSVGFWVERKGQTSRAGRLLGLSSSSFDSVLCEALRLISKKEKEEKEWSFTV
ncbi:hypothetical protein Droror1_Dr00016411 [Drosera rotundifolia]